MAKTYVPALATSFGIVFLSFYQDLYLLYFNIFVPIAVIALGDLLVTIEKHTKNYGGIIVLLSIIIVINLFNVGRYINTIHGFMAIPNITEFVNIVENTKPDYLYGEFGIVQGISYLSGIPMLEGVSDTNRTMFLAGVLDKNTITEKVKKTNTVVIANSSDNNLDIGTASAYLNWGELKNQCKIIHSQDFKTGSSVNKINIVKCF